jgi:hypothetical protein
MFFENKKVITAINTDGGKIFIPECSQLKYNDLHIGLHKNTAMLTYKLSCIFNNENIYIDFTKYFGCNKINFCHDDFLWNEVFDKDILKFIS